MKEKIVIIYGVTFLHFHPLPFFKRPKRKRSEWLVAWLRRGEGNEEVVFSGGGDEGKDVRGDGGWRKWVVGGG